MALNAKIITGQWRKTLNLIDAEDKANDDAPRSMNLVGEELAALFHDLHLVQSDIAERERDLVTRQGDEHRLQLVIKDKQSELAAMVKTYGVKVVP